MERASGGPGRLGCALAILIVAAVVASFFWSFRQPATGVPALVVTVAVAVLLLRRARRREIAEDRAERTRLRAIAAPQGDAWRRLLQAEGLGAHVETLGPRVRHAVRLTTSRADDLPLGASRLGGGPDLPEGLAWPTWRDKPLAFLAQIDLGSAGGGLLPEAGHLCFFYAANATWGFDPDDRGSSVVVYLPAGTPLRRVDPPEALPEKVRFKSCAVEVERYEDLPDFEGDPLEELLDEPASERYFEIRAFLSGGDAGGPAHKLLGHPEPIQNPMELQCQLATNGLFCGDRSGYEDPRAAALEPGSKDWRLLLQLDSDEAAGMMWGDAGRLYVWIREADLVERRFENAWLILQCH